MINILIILILLAMVGGAAAYVIKAKKRGQKCIGCPYAKQCASSGCSCSGLPL